MKITRERVGEVLTQIYKSEIPIRIEWVYDGGFTWALIGHNGPADDRNFPRTWLDDQQAGKYARACAISPHAAQQIEKIHPLQVDWVARDSADTIEAAVGALASAICERYPESDFAKWFSDADEQPENHGNCPRCGTALFIVRYAGRASRVNPDRLRCTNCPWKHDLPLDYGKKPLTPPADRQNKGSQGS